jgi:YD repeat-containing protein
MPYHSTDILVKPANPCDFPKSKQPLFFIPVDVSAGVKIPINTNSAYEGDLNVGLNASFYYDPTKNDAFVELNTMVVYGKQIKKIISPNFEITFNSDALFKKDYATNNFKKIIPGYNIGQFSDVARKDIQGEHVLSTAEMKRNSTVSLTEEGLSYNYDNWGVKIGSVPMIYYDNGSFSANLSGTGLFLSWKGKIYREDLTKPFMHEHNRLKNIQIYDKSSQLSKAYYFDYDYFTPREVSSLATLDEKSDLPATFYKQLHNKYINVAGADKYRLKLKGVYEMVLNSQNEPTSLIPGYTFDYNLTPLPRRLSMAQDHWGYYNGEHANRNKTQFIARMTYNTYDLSGNVVQQGGQYPCPNSSNRDANLEFCKAGILEKITYPTGGSKTFNYELHAAHNFPKPVGGLRIESIQTYDPVLAKTYIESYTYKHEYIADRSSGFLSVYPDYYFTHKNEDLPRIVHADYMNHLLSDFVNDGYISYARVMVKQTGTGTGNGYSVHEFNNFERPATDRKNIISDAPITPSNFSFDSYNSSVEHSDENLTGNITGQYDENYYANLTKRPEYDYTKGSLKRTAIFTEANKLVKEILYEYTQPENIPVKTIKAADVIKRLPFEKLSAGVQIGIWVIPVPPFVMPGIGLDMTLQAERTGEAYPYEINVGKFHLLKQIERNYNLNDGGYLTSEVNFEYSPKHHELVKQTTKNSNGDVVENIRKFSFDLVPEETAVIIPLPNVTPLVSEYLPRLSKEERYINLLLEDVTKRNGKVIGGKVNIYHDDANAGIGVVKQIAGLIKEEYVLETNVPLNDFNEIKNLVKVTINPSNLTSTRESFLTIDPRYTLRSQYTEYNNRGLLVKSNKVGFPSSKITYGYNDLIPIQVTQETNKGNRSVNYELIPLYGVTRTINPDGTELRYRYDSVGRLLEIRDINNKLVKSYQYNYRAQ